MLLNLKLLSWTLNIAYKQSILTITCYKKPKAETAGITSRCIDLKHVLFLDYDNIERWLVEDELSLIAKQFNLTPFYLFTTHEAKSKISNEIAGNYHAICLTKMPMQMISEIQRQCHVDPNYLRMYKISRYKAWVLRTIAKKHRPMPKFIKTIGAMPQPNQDYPITISTAHKNYLEQNYSKLPKLKYESEDNETKLFLTSYRTNAGI